MELFLAVEFIPYEGDIIKGIFTTIDAAKKAAVYSKDSKSNIGKVYKLDINTKLTIKDFVEGDCQVWEENIEEK